MKNAITRLAIAAGLATTSGCAFAGPGAVMGTIYSGYSLGAGVGPGTGAKSGEACVMSILGVVALGDGSIEAAKQDGGITQVASVDHTVFSILGLYANVCTKVTGQ
jgi:hypothetical protein